MISKIAGAGVRKSFVLLLFVLTAVCLNAEPVSRKTAFNVAKGFALSQQISLTDSFITDLTPEGEFRQMYIFGFITTTNARITAGHMCWLAVWQLPRRR